MISFWIFLVLVVEGGCVFAALIAWLVDEFVVLNQSPGLYLSVGAFLPVYSVVYVFDYIRTDLRGGEDD